MKKKIKALKDMGITELAEEQKTTPFKLLKDWVERRGGN